MRAVRAGSSRSDGVTIELGDTTVTARRWWVRWSIRAAVLVASAAAGVVVAWLLIGRGEHAAPFDALAVPGAGAGVATAVSVWLIRRWRPLLGLWTAAAAVGLCWSALLTGAAMTPAECPTDNDLVGGRCSFAEAASFAAVGVLVVVLLMLLASPWMMFKSGRAAHRRVRAWADRKLGRNGPAEEKRAKVAATKRTNAPGAPKARKRRRGRR